MAAACSSFRGGATRVGLSPAAFGARIQRLEDQVGARLFVRASRRVALTRQGVELLPRAQRCLDEAERCARALDRKEPAPYELRIGTRFEVGMDWVVPSLGALERARPERKVHLYFGDTDYLLEQMLHDRLHGVVTSARISTPNLVFARLQQEEYALVGARSLVNQTPLLGPRDAPRHVLLDVHADLPLFRYFLDARSPKEEWVFDRVQYLGGIAAVRARVLEGAGVAVLPRFYVRGHVHRQLERLMPGTRLPRDWQRMVWRRGQPLEAHLRTFASDLAQRPLR